jgi:hypothetical protein
MDSGSMVALWKSGGLCRDRCASVSVSFRFFFFLFLSFFFFFERREVLKDFHSPFSLSNAIEFEISLPFDSNCFPFSRPYSSQRLASVEGYTKLLRSESLAVYEGLVGYDCDVALDAFIERKSLTTKYEYESCPID